MVMSADYGDGGMMRVTIPGLEQSHIESTDTLSCCHKPAKTLFIQDSSSLYPSSLSLHLTLHPYKSYGVADMLCLCETRLTSRVCKINCVLMWQPWHLVTSEC